MQSGCDATIAIAREVQHELPGGVAQLYISIDGFLLCWPSVVPGTIDL
jgi:hypothetical protein